MRLAQGYKEQKPANNWNHWAEEDRFFRGFIIGLIAGTVKDLPAFILEVLFNQPHPTFWDNMSLLSIGKLPKTFAEYFFVGMVQVGYSVGIAILIVYLRSAIRSKHFILQGILFGLSAWFLIRGMVFFFQIKVLAQFTILNAFLNSGLSIIFGVLVTTLDYYLTKKISQMSGI